MMRDRILSRLYKRTRYGLNEAARRRLLDQRSRLITLDRKNDLMSIIDRNLNYSGLSVKIPFMKAEFLLLLNVLLIAVLFVIGLCFTSLPVSLAIAAFSILLEVVLFYFARSIQQKRVSRQLLKFLDFLGNYSITSGEISNIFYQISRYMEEPLRSTLEECFYETQVSGDISLALLTLVERIEHPKFKEIIRNLEISCRYSADLKILVDANRRSVREYLRAVQEQKSMMREAFINMFLLIALSAFALFSVSRLVEISIMEMLFGALPGKIAVGVVGFIFLLFAGKVTKMSA